MPLCATCHGLVHDRVMSGRELTRAAMARVKAQGRRVGGVPYGFRLAADGRTLETDEGEAAVVAAVRELRASGLSLRRIISRMNAEGVPCRGQRWHPTTVARLLKDVAKNEADAVL